MNVKVKMITGDQEAIAKEIAGRIGMGTNIQNVKKLIRTTGGGEKEAITALANIVEEADGFAEVLPEHKYNIVRALQTKNHIVGMTGDGVNDGNNQSFFLKKYNFFSSSTCFKEG